jgi:hypothetical protein
VETFLLPSNGIGLVPTILLIVVAVVAAIHFFFPRESQPRLNKGLAAAIVVSLLVAGGLAANLLNPSASSITVGQGQVSINMQGVGSMSFTAAEMKQAYVQNVGEGVLASMFKQVGTNVGDYNVGTFSLRNGATAYVVSDDASNVVVELNNGAYVVMGPPSDNFTAFVGYFSENVLQVANTSSST